MSSSAKRPFAEREVADYERRRYRGVDQRLVHSREVRLLKKAARLIAKEKPLPPSSLALDAPCGYGRFSGFLLSHGFRLVSCDLSLAMVKRARTRDQSSTIPLGIVANVTGGLPFREDVFPLVFSLRLFHHLHQPEERRAVLAAFSRVSAGWLILSYYQANPLHAAQRVLRRLVKRSKTRIRMISRREFQDEAEGAGFRIVRVFPLFRGFHAQHVALLKKI